ncbi:hypothetical protein VP1G_06838 [Cytospora mali]|uniref:Uncharacterized protein n=1 Tax=Cytospora mali TaxID=578113 RepID=A0A194V6S5_CYTMA|nr:hypothetical protein VP1G_06838 [Valsa mali var. pyri (nom. inval.)]
MRPSSSLLGLPASLLLLIAAHIGEAQANARGGLPTAIRKMSPDAGEKLFQEYFAFAEEDKVADVVTQAQPAATPAYRPGEEELLATNSSAPMPYYAPFAPHFDSGPDAREDTGTGAGDETSSGWDLFRRAKDVVAKLGKRDYACPTGTSNCSSIGYPNSCCQTGTQRAKLNRYYNSGVADKHSYLDSRRIFYDCCGHHHRVNTFICEHLYEKNDLYFVFRGPNNYHSNLLHILKHPYLYNNNKNINNSNININRNLHQPRRTSPSHLHKHHHHANSILLPNRLLCLLSSLRRRLLPDWPRLPDDLLPVHAVHDPRLQRRDDRRARDGRPFHHRAANDGDVRGRVVDVSHGRGAYCWVLPDRV